MRLYDIAFAKQLRRASVREAVREADAIFCDANLTADALVRMPKLAAGKPIFAIAISPAKATRLAPILADLACLFLNTREAGALTGLGREATGNRYGDGTARIGCQARGAVERRPTPCSPLRAGLFASRRLPHAVSPMSPAPAMRWPAPGGGSSARSPFREAVREGLAAALLTLECAEAVPAFSEADFAAALTLVPRPDTADAAANRRVRCRLRQQWPISIFSSPSPRRSPPGGRSWRWKARSSPMACPIPTTAAWRAMSSASSPTKAPRRPRSRSLTAASRSACRRTNARHLAKLQGAMKLSRADFGFAVAQGRTGGTTVAATMIAARMAGI